MERRTVFLASVGALSAVACGGEPDEAYGELQQAVITPALLIRSITYSGTTAGSLIKLTVVVSAALFLGTIVLMKGAPAQATSGTFTKGASKRPGSADVTISAERFADILADVGPFNSRIELAYNPTQGTVSDIFVEYV